MQMCLKISSSHECAYDINSIKYYECAYTCFNYLTCKLYLLCSTLYSHLWYVWLYHIFPHYLIKAMIFWKKIYWTQNVCFVLSKTFVLNTYHSNKNSVIYHKFTYVSCKVPVILVSFQSELNFSIIFKKSSDIKFHENSSSGRQVVPCRQTDGWTNWNGEANNHILQLCECA